MKIFQATTLLLSVVWSLAPGALAFADGSDDTCPLPSGPDPECAIPPKFEKLPHPEDSHYWIQCDSYSQPICKKCPTGQNFNTVIKDCETSTLSTSPTSPATSPTSTPTTKSPSPTSTTPTSPSPDSTSPTSTPPTSTSPPPTPPITSWPPGSIASCPPGPIPVCTAPPQWDEKLPHPTDSHYWIHCDAGGQPICKICPADLRFSIVTKDCEWP